MLINLQGFKLTNESRHEAAAFSNGICSWYKGNAAIIYGKSDSEIAYIGDWLLKTELGVFHMTDDSIMNALGLQWDLQSGPTTMDEIQLLMKEKVLNATNY
jgi:hypothetical protein